MAIALDRRSARAILHFGKWIFVSTALTFLIRGSDRLVAGHYLDMATLGVFSLALNFAMLPETVGLKFASSIIYPMVAKQVRERGSVTQSLARVRGAFALSIPCIVLASQFVASPVFHVLFDARYEGAGAIFALLVGGTAINVLTHTGAYTILGLGDARLQAVVQACRAVVFVGCLGVAGAVGANPAALALGFTVGRFLEYLVVAVGLGTRSIRLGAAEHVCVVSSLGLAFAFS